MVSDAIAGGNSQAINYFIAQDYVKAISQFATSPNAKTILFPVEATQLIGTLGGIGELARDAFGHAPADDTRSSGTQIPITRERQAVARDTPVARDKG